MAKRKNTGKSTGKSISGGSDDEVISFTPSAGFDIRKAAAHLHEMMEDIGQPLIIYLPNIAVEFEVGCTRKQIIDGYNQALKASLAVKPANADIPKKKK
jgi:hypothetical protein